MHKAVARRLRWLVLLIAAIWVLQIMNFLSGYWFSDWLGLIPRHVQGIDGILFMPLLHNSFPHAVSNTVPLAVLGTLLSMTSGRNLAVINATILLVGGTLVWLFAREALHVGASGLIFGWFAFLAIRGFDERRPLPLAVSIGVILAYGGIIWGALPGTPGVSWEAHLAGAIGGVVAAAYVPTAVRSKT